MIQERTKRAVVLIDAPWQVRAEVERLLGYGLDIGFDLETTSTDPINDRVVTIALKPRGKISTVIDVRHWTDAELLGLGPTLSGLFDGSVTIVGQNLKFDLEFMLAKCGLAAHKVYDTMIAEQVILGLGVSSAAEKGVHFDLASIGNKYGVEVHKEERSWFIDLDKRIEGQVLSQVGITRTLVEGGEDAEGNLIDDYYDEVPEYAMVGGTRPWDLPLPEDQITYIRQDVSVVHKIKDAQQVAIKEYGLQEVIDLEMRTILPLVGIEHWGVQINREGWLAVIDEVTRKMKALEWDLHLGTPEYAGLDVHVLKVRNDRYLEKWQPYEKWMNERDAWVRRAKEMWDGDIVSHTAYKNWSEFKKSQQDEFYAEHSKVDKPPTNKEGVNLGSWMQVRDGFNDLFSDPQYWQPDPLIAGKLKPIELNSVSEDLLEPYRGMHPLVGVYIDYTHARKIVTSYGREKIGRSKPFIEMLDENDRLRASYQQIGADTGRMSSHSPNLQQIPEKGEVGTELRKNVIAAPGYTLIDADFSNIELRGIAELSGDKFLLDAFKSGQDIHAYTAVVMFKLSIPEGENWKKWTSSHDAVIGGRTLVGTSYRTIAKTINYMLLYGAGVKKLAAMLGISEADAKAVLNTYYATFAAAIFFLAAQKARLDDAKRAGERRTFAQTRAGRRRWFDIPEYPIHPANKGTRLTVDAVDKWQEDVDGWKGRMAAIKRQLANTPIQGMSADITKEACARWYECVGYDDEMRLVAVIHDELIVEATEGRADEAASLLNAVMMWAMDKYLHVVDKGEIDAVTTPYWSH
jgi:DNA polymerase I